MAAPWFDPNEFGAWYHYIRDAMGTIMILFTGLLSVFVGRGIGRKWVLGILYAFIAIGVSQLLFGICALCAGQAWEIWFVPLLFGVIVSVLVPPLAVLARFEYRMIEKRRLEAEGLRKG